MNPLFEKAAAAETQVSGALVTNLTAGEYDMKTLADLGVIPPYYHRNNEKCFKIIYDNQKIINKCDLELQPIPEDQYSNSNGVSTIEVDFLASVTVKELRKTLKSVNK
jgi:hypothetical protein